MANPFENKYLPHPYWRLNVVWDVSLNKSLYTAKVLDETYDSIRIEDARGTILEIPKKFIESSKMIPEQTFDNICQTEQRKLRY